MVIMIWIMEPTTTKVSRNNNRVVLVLQGGGALGAYQAGVYQGLQEHGLVPDWVVGTSIGAINAAIIAGNNEAARLAQLTDFWDSVAYSDIFNMKKTPDKIRQFNTWLTILNVMTHGVPGFFLPRSFNPFALGLPVKPEEASYYDTSSLIQTLARLVDFDYLNHSQAMRLTVGSMQVTNGNLVNFDSIQQEIGIEHVMASGAMPPGFPPIRIDGELYWDGGLYSNTPLEVVLDDEPRIDTLCFMVDLWSAKGAEPRTLDEVRTRQKDVMYASRSKRHIHAFLEMNMLRAKLRILRDKLPLELQSEIDLEAVGAAGSETTMHIVRLPYSGRDWNMAAKDINFSRGSIKWRWDQGYRDVTRAIQQASWLLPITFGTSVVLHELEPHRRAYDDVA